MRITIAADGGGMDKFCGGSQVFVCTEERDDAISV